MLGYVEFVSCGLFVQAVIDAVSIELTCWQQLHLHNSSSSSSSHWPHFSPSGLKAIMQADFADVIRPVASAQQEQQPQQQSYHQLHQQPHEEGIVGLQHSVGAAESCCSSSSKLNNSCGHTACNGAEQQQPEAEAAVRHHQQNQQSMTKQQRHEQEEAVLQQPKQQSPQQQQQQAPVIHSRLPVIGHSIDFITCQGCGYRYGHHKPVWAVVNQQEAQVVVPVAVPGLQSCVRCMQLFCSRLQS